MTKKHFQPYRFDFEIGYLVKSPCKTCESRKIFPACMDSCRLIDGIHALLSHTISCSRGFSSCESFALSQQGWERK
ncbi:MAG: hypothetical protein Q8P24_18175 [Desulfobacterales bacterium]|nr:hypothetical protein [Desulfobacterales bacterium]